MRARSAAAERDAAEGLPRALVAGLSRHFVTLADEAKVTFWKRLEDAVCVHIERNGKRSRSRDSAPFRKKSKYMALVDYSERTDSEDS